MSGADRFAGLAGTLAGVSALLGVWIVLASLVLPDAEFTATHLVVGVVVAVVAAWYAIRLYRNPATKLSSVWFLVVLGALLLVGTLLSATPGTIAYWSAVLASAKLTLLGVVSIALGSRFSGNETQTSIFRKS